MVLAAVSYDEPDIGYLLMGALLHAHLEGGHGTYTPMLAFYSQDTSNLLES